MADEFAAAPGAADISFELASALADGASETITLRPALGCIVRLCRQPGGLHSTVPGQSTVHSRVSACELDTMSEVIRAGLAIGANAARDLPERIVKTGVFEVRAFLQIFVAICGNGGRPLLTPKEEGEEEDKGEGVPLGPSNTLSKASS